jgi:16S rRNA (cytosine967-C5)-methyltransferase
VLVDAPCSGLGVLGRRPDARWRVDPDTVERLAALQLELLLGAAPTVVPGGHLIYSVCTLTRRETVEVAAAATAALAGFEPHPLVESERWRAWGDGGLLLPQDHGTDGMALFRWQRNG